MWGHLKLPSAHATKSNHLCLLRNLYSSRKIEQVFGENIHFIWISGQNKPDHNTINDFRGKRLKGPFKKIFNQLVLLLNEQGYLSLKEIYVDGIKLEANANKYTFVWAKNIKTNRGKITKELWRYAQKVYADEEQTTNDTTTLKSHLQEHIDSFNQVSDTLTADAGYGSEENYQELENQDTEAFVKYNYFHKEQKKAKSKIDKKPFTVNKLYYNEQTDTYYCPMGQAMNNIGTYQKKTANDYLQTISKYQAKNCEGCPIRSLCHKAKGNRIVECNHNLIRLKAKAKEKLLSEQGIAHRKQRCWDLEVIFGNIKQNMNFKRFMLKGIDKVEAEFGLIAMAQNLKKMSLAI